MADPLDQTSLNVVAQSADACLFCLEMRGGKLRSLAKPDDCRRVLRATPPAAFLMPPRISGLYFTPLRTYSAPIPFGPCSLCPDKESMSISVVLRLIGVFPTACTASV